MKALVGEELYEVRFEGTLNKRTNRALDLVLKKDSDEKTFPFFWDQIFYLAHLYLSQVSYVVRRAEEGLYWYIRHVPGSLYMEYRKAGITESMVFKGVEYRNFLAGVSNLACFYSDSYYLPYQDKNLLFWWYKERNKEGVYGLEVTLGSRKLNFDRVAAFALAFPEVEVGLSGLLRVEKNRLLVGKQVFEGEDYVRLLKGACRLLLVLK